MRLTKIDGADVLELEEDDEVRLVAPKSYLGGALLTTCVYLRVYRGKLEFEGGAGIIGRIAGKGMKDKASDE